MEKIKALVLVAILTVGLGVLSVGADEQKFANIRSQEIVGKIINVDLENSMIELEYVSDVQSHGKQTGTFYITDATMIDVAMVKSTLNDLKIGTNVLLEFAQMPDGAKVVESVWVKKS